MPATAQSCPLLFSSFPRRCKLPGSFINPSSLIKTLSDSAPMGADISTGCFGCDANKLTTLTDLHRQILAVGGRLTARGAGRRAAISRVFHGHIIYDAFSPSWGSAVLPLMRRDQLACARRRRWISMKSPELARISRVRRERLILTKKSELSAYACYAIQWMAWLRYHRAPRQAAKFSG